MKSLLVVLMLLASSASFAAPPGDDSRFANQQGAFLGQEPPGNIPQMFAPGLVSTAFSDGVVWFSPSGDRMCFGHYSGPPARLSIWLYSYIENGSWVEPRLLKFEGIERIGYQFIGQHDQLYFSGREPGADISSLYVADKSDTGWGTPVKIEFADGNEHNRSLGYPSVARSGNLYVQVNMGGDENDGSGNADIYLSTYTNGSYSALKKMGTEINTQWHECHPYVAADESYLIYNSASYPEGEGMGSCDLYISFRNADGTWRSAVNMGSTVNSKYSEGRPSGSWDGKYLFFASTRVDSVRLATEPESYEELIDIVQNPRNGLEDIYWVETGVLTKLRNQ